VRVVILFGSEMGTAEAAVDSIADVLAADHDASVYDMFDSMSRTSMCATSETVAPPVDGLPSCCA
jgi:flavodoxin